jgi:BirA family biotin operon repressor/biotin-[acetyl-CoA-carboxylase] ligase
VVISPTTLFTGQQLIWLPACASTNSEAQQLLRENRASEGCTVITDDQFAGRGQRGNQWLAAPGENLTLSIVWMPTFLQAGQQFLLSQAVALGIHDWAAALLQPSDKLRLKWPNDLYFGSQKFGGVLIENSLSGSKIQSSIVGIGLNINQRHFSVPTATSLGVLTGRYFQREVLAARLLECLERRYLQLRAGRLRELRHDYLASLYRYQEWHEYEVGGRRVHGQIVGVEPDGRLALQINDEVQHFGLQEIKYL